VKGRGSPHIKGGGRGDLLVKIKVDVPVDLTKEQKHILRQFADSRNENPREALKQG
jgi:molecular chaperone DnaJ